MDFMSDGLLGIIVALVWFVVYMIGLNKCFPSKPKEKFKDEK